MGRPSCVVVFFSKLLFVKSFIFYFYFVCVGMGKMCRDWGNVGDGKGCTVRWQGKGKGELRLTGKGAGRLTGSITGRMKGRMTGRDIGMGRGRNGRRG